LSADGVVAPDKTGSIEIVGICVERIPDCASQLFSFLSVFAPAQNDAIEFRPRSLRQLQE
jgi:hypothetical protein